MNWSAFWGITLIGFLAFLDFTIVNTALPIIQKELQMSVISLQWIMNIYFLVLAICMTVAGKLGDSFGHRKIFEIGSIIFLLASILAGLAMSGSMIILGRFFQAIGASIIFPMAPSLLNDVFQSQKTKALGIYGAISGVGLAVGPVIGALLTTYISWRAIFFVNIPIGIIALLICFFTLNKSSKKKKEHIDWGGFVLFLFGIGGLVFGVIESAKSGWESPITLTSIFIGVIGLIWFGFYENKQKDPFIDLKLFQKPLFFLGSISCMIGGIMSAILLFFLPLYLHSIRGVSILKTGWIIFSMTLIYIIFSLFVHKFVSRFSLVNNILVGLLFAVAGAALFYPLDLTISVYMAILPCAFIGITWAVGNILSTVAAQDAVSKNKIGIATGVVYSLFNTGGSIVLAIAIAIFKKGETSFLKNLVEKGKVQLSETQSHEIYSALANPSDADAYLVHTSPRLMNYFKQAFIEGLHDVTTLVLVVAILVFIASVIARGQIKKA